MYKPLKQQLNTGNNIYKPHDHVVPIPPPNFNIFHYKGNRKYIDGNSLYPVDSDESDRIQFQDYICNLVWGNHFSAPVSELLKKGDAKILEVGCGPGMWTLEVAAQYPKAKFTGVDIAPTYPIQTKPLNVEFLQANVVKGLPYEDNTFDYVTCRFMNFSYTINDWEIVISEMSRVCKVDGYIEIMEKDVEFENEGNFTREARLRFMRKLRKKKNIEPIITPKIKQFINKSKYLTDITFDKRKVPIGKWGKEIGESNKYIFKWGADNLKNVMMECGYNDKEWDATVDKVLKELSDNHGYDCIHRIWARKEFCQEIEKEKEKKSKVECSPNFWSRYKKYINTTIST